MRDYLVDTLSGEAAPRLHFVSHHSCQELQAELAELASATNGHFHSVCMEAENNEEVVSVGSTQVMILPSFLDVCG